jgi:hypothetical protein
MIVGVGGMAAEEDVAIVVNRGDFDSCFAEESVRVSAGCAPKRIEDYAQFGFLNYLEVNDFL